MKCNDCVYFKRCVVLGVELDMHHNKEADKNCRHFKNKTDFAEVQHGEWIEKEHWVPLPRDYEVSYVEEDYDECYDEKTHSAKEKYWHCSCCDYEASRSMKPWFDYCPNCGARMGGKLK